MPDFRPRPGPRPGSAGLPAGSAGWWIIALALAVTFVAADSYARMQHLRAMAALYGERVAAPRFDAASPTGFALGRRVLVQPGSTADSYHVVMQTQEMLAGGPWRLHRVDYDNAPFGREMHWASPPRWWLALLAWADRAWSGRPLGAAAEHAAFYSNPLLLALFLSGFIPIVARRFGSAAAALLAIGMVSTYPFYLNFIAGNAEHQGAAEACALLTVVCLLGGAGGCVRTVGARLGETAEGTPVGGEISPSLRRTRRWFLASAAAGGAGLWLSAASEAPMLVSTGLGGIALLWICRHRGGTTAGILVPELWRFWGAAGCAASFAAYGIEYFPRQMGWRLEVNHPLYGLAWLGGGELICQLGRRWSRPPGAPRPRGELAATVAAASLASLLPIVILATRRQTFLVADPFMWRLHTGYIAEFHSMRWSFRQSGWSFTTTGRLLPLLLTVLAALFLWRKETTLYWKAQLALALVPAGVELALAANQLRWWGLASGLALATALPWFTWLESEFPRGHSARWWRLAAVLLVLPGAINAVRLIPAESIFSAGNIWDLADRDLAHWLRLRAGHDRVVVLSTPNTTTSLIYHGGLRGLGTLYWENRDGLEAAAEIFAAGTVEQAHTLIARREITHLVIASWDPFAAAYVALARPGAPGSPAAAHPFTDVLLGAAPLPPWLRAIPYPLPSIPALRGQSVRILEVTAPQHSEDILVHRAADLIELGRLEEASGMLPALQALPDYLPALAVSARILGERGDAAGVETTVQRILARGTPAGDLPAEDQVRVAVGLSIGGKLGDARRVLAACLQRLDERALRRLTAGTLSDLLSLSDHLEVAFPDATLRALAAEILPPNLR